MSATLSLFERRSLARIMMQMKPPQSFLIDTFFPTVETHAATHVDIDIVKGKRRVAAYVNPIMEGKVVDRIGYKTNTVDPPYIKAKRGIRPLDLQQRLPGETVYSDGMTGVERAAALVGKDLAELDEMITRAEELQAAQALQGGVITLTEEGGPVAQVDLSMSSSHKITLTSGARWNQTTATPLTDLKTWRRLILQDSGVAPTDVILGSAVLDPFIDNAQVKDHLSRFWMNPGNFAPDYQNDHVMFVGRINEIGMNIWAYDEFFIDNADDTEKPLIGTNNVIVATRNVRTSRNYAVIQDMKANYVTPRFAKSWEVEDPSVRWLLVQSAPLVLIHQVDAFVSVTAF